MRHASCELTAPAFFGSRDEMRCAAALGQLHVVQVPPGHGMPEGCFRIKAGDSSQVLVIVYSNRTRADDLAYHRKPNLQPGRGRS